MADDEPWFSNIRAALAFAGRDGPGFEVQIARTSRLDIVGRNPLNADPGVLLSTGDRQHGDQQDSKQAHAGEYAPLGGGSLG